MTKLSFFIIAAIAAMIIGLIHFAKDRIIGLIWNIFFKYASDEKLERIVRYQYEFYNQNRKAFNDDGLCWLIDMATYLCCVWRNKIKVPEKDFNKIRPEQSQTLSYWQNALQQLTYEVNRRKYFIS